MRVNDMEFSVRAEWNNFVRGPGAVILPPPRDHLVLSPLFSKLVPGNVLVSRPYPKIANFGDSDNLAFHSFGDHFKAVGKVDGHA